MRNLLSADWKKLRGSRIFWALLLTGAAASLISLREHYSMAIAEIRDGELWPMDEAFFQFPVLNGALLSAFIPLFIGADFSDGTIRNKLIAGRRRSSVYGSWLLTAFAGSGLLTAATAAVNMAAGLLKGGRLTMAGGRLVGFICSAFLCSFAFASVFVLITTLIVNRTFSSVTCIGVFLLMILLTSKLISLLSVAPEARDLLSVVGGKPVFSEPYPNPMYISGGKRTLMELLVDLLPTGQSIQMSNLDAERIGRFPSLSAAFILLTSAVGLLCFRIKDLK